jgi:fructose-bisphosphate aldolase class I
MKTPDFNQQQFEQMKTHPGFIAALDQSGGSTPGALRLYGVKESAWSNEAEMFALVHQMRKRIITSPSFNGERIIGAILFEDTMERDIESLPTADYLWNVKQVVPFLKVDQGLAAEQDGVQLMKAMPALAELLTKAKAKSIFGTKMRSLIKRADQAGINSIVNQQFEVAEQILAAGLLPIVEPEVDVHSIEKAKSERLLKAAILEKLNQLTADEFVMLKLTLPEQDDLYLDLIRHPKVVRVVALSGGYSQEDADDRLRKDHGMVASFSRALVEGLSAQQSDAEFNSVLEKSIQNIFDASNTKQPTIIESDWNRITIPPNNNVVGIISEKDPRYGQR